MAGALRGGISDMIDAAALLNCSGRQRWGSGELGLAPQLFSLCDLLQEISRGLKRWIEFECLLERRPGLLCLPGAQQCGGEIGTDQDHRGVDGESLVPEIDGLIHVAEL